MSSFSSLTVRPSGCERIKLRTVSMARSCSGNLRLYDTIPPHGLPLLYLEGGTLGSGAYSRKTSSRQTVDQTTASATRKGRHKQQMYQSQFLGSSIALESFSITAKILAPRTLQPIAGRR